MAFDNNLYCDFDSSTTKAIAGKDLLLAIFDKTGANLLAIAGQQGLTINRSTDTLEVSSKDTVGGWKSQIAGMREWSIEQSGFYSPSDESQRVLAEAFDNGDPVCVKVVDGKRKKGMFGGLAVISEYSIEAPHDDAVTISLSLNGNGKLTDFSLLSSEDANKATTLPKGM